MLDVILVDKSIFQIPGNATEAQYSCEPSMSQHILYDLISSVTAWVRASISVSRESQQQRSHTQIHPMAAMLISWLLTDSTEALTGLVSGNMGCVYVCWMSDYPGGHSACVLSFSLIAWMCTADMSCPAFVAKMNVEYLTLTIPPFQGVLGLSVRVPEASFYASSRRQF